jgi:hypothetical protein
MEPKLIRLNAENEFKLCGLPFRNSNAARWCYRQRHMHGLAGAFKKMGKQIWIDVPKFHALVASRS